MPLQAMIKASSASSLIFQVIDRTPLVDALSKDGRKPHSFPMGDIEMRNIRFSYPGGGDRDKSIVLGGSPFVGDDGGFSLTFPAGKTTAIVGPSGAGKSTVVALLERWYEPQEGSILVGGVDIGEYNLRWWRGRIGFVMQEPFLFNKSIYKNVVDGLEGTVWESLPEDEKREMVQSACADANAAGFVEALPEGYDTVVGENGVKLSGGQKQRIAIARSIISKPAVLILDEATSALDPVSERVVQRALDRVSKGRTTITIAHRLSTVRNADKIVVLEEGNVIETGSHEELLSQEEGIYSNLVRGQALLLDELHEVLDVDPFADPEDDYDVEDLDFEQLGYGGKHDEGCQTQKKKKWKHIGIFKLFYLVFSEQRKFLWLTYIGGLVGAIGAGKLFPYKIEDLDLWY